MRRSVKNGHGRSWVAGSSALEEVLFSYAILLAVCRQAGRQAGSSWSPCTPSQAARQQARQREDVCVFGLWCLQKGFVDISQTKQKGARNS